MDLALSALAGLPFDAFESNSHLFMSRFPVHETSHPLLTMSLYHVPHPILTFAVHHVLLMIESGVQLSILYESPSPVATLYTEVTSG